MFRPLLGIHFAASPIVSLSPINKLGRPRSSYEPSAAPPHRNNPSTVNSERRKLKAATVTVDVESEDTAGYEERRQNGRPDARGDVSATRDEHIRWRDADTTCNV